MHVLFINISMRVAALPAITITGARGTELPPLYLIFCLHIYFQ